MDIPKNSNRIILICRVMVALQEDVSSMYTHTDDYSKIVSFVSGKSWSEIIFSPGTAKLLEKQKDEEAGELIDQSLKISFPGCDKSNESLFVQWMNKGLIVRMDTDSGYSIVFGSPENPALMRRIFDTSSKSTGTEVEFYCTSQYFSWNLIVT